MPDLTSTDGLRIHVEDEGQGPPILLIHGWCGSTRVWDPLVPLLANERRVVRMDLRGCGSSQGEEHTADFDHYAADLRLVLEKLALDNVTVVGWSMGAGVVLRYVQNHGTDGLQGISAIDFPIQLDEKKDVADKVCHQLNKRRDEFLHSFMARMLRTENPEAKALLVREAKRTTRRDACAMYRAMGRAQVPLDETFPVPALLAFPEHGWFPDALADWRIRFPEHEAPLFPNSRHAPPLEETAAFGRELLEFTEPIGRLNVSNV
jgi:pimeloyl-ACP methyl ester carboxylesterase